MQPSERVFTVVLLLFAFALRVTGLAWGQPDPQYAPSFAPYGMIHEQTPLHPDEFLFAALPFRVVLDPLYAFEFYENPSFLINLSAWTTRLTGAANGLNAADRAGYNDRYYAPFNVYVVNRLYSMLGGLLTVAAVYALARRLAGRWSALVAGLLAAVSLPLVQHAHYSTTSSLATGFVSVCLFLTALAVLDRRQRVQQIALIAAGIAAGLALGNRYNTVFVSLGVLLVGVWHGWQQRRNLWHSRWGFVIIVAWLAFPLTFVLTTPGILTDTSDVLADLRYISDQYLGAGGMLFSMNAWSGLVQQIGFTLTFGIGWVAALMVLAGTAAGVRMGRHHRAVIGLLWLFLMLHLLLINRTVRPMGADQLTLPLMPALAVLAGVGAAAMLRRLPLIGQTILVGLVVVMPLFMSLTVLRIISTSDNREIVQGWVYDHLPRHSTIRLLGSINVALDARDYRWQQVYDVPANTDWQALPPTDYLIVSHALIQRYIKASVPVVDNLPDGAELLLRVFLAPRMGNDWIVYTADYFHSPTLSVYCLNPTACDATIAQR